MKSGKFNIIVTLNVFFIAFISALFFLVAGKQGYTFTTLGLFCIWLTGIFALIQYVHLTNRNLLVFLQSFRFHDSTIEFNRIKKFPFQPIYTEFNRIINEFQELKQQKESEHQYFEHVIKHVNTGLIAWDVNERVTLINETAKKILKTPFVSSLNAFNAFSKELREKLKSLKPGIKRIERIDIGNNMITVSLDLSRFKSGNDLINLVAVNDLGDELEENESQAWQKLLKILNHEIVNSLSPIKLVSSALSKNLETGEYPEVVGSKFQSEFVEGLRAIYNRSTGLMHFIEDYKAISEVPKPEFKKESVLDMILSLVSLIKNTLVPERVKISTHEIDGDLTFWADRKLIEQVLINLVKNAVHALENRPDPCIILLAYRKDDLTVIEIRDNGSGIPFNIRDFIFMPFFTTKKEGSGIGLSWARQVMKLHKGQIHVDSKEGMGTSVMLSFA